MSESKPVLSGDELHANPRLISAAPDLLEALQKMVKMASTGMVDFNPHDEFVMSSARAAIAKALGEAK